MLTPHRGPSSKAEVAASNTFCGNSPHTVDGASRRGHPSAWGELRLEAGRVT